MLLQAPRAAGTRIGTIHGFCASSQASETCGGCGRHKTGRGNRWVVAGVVVRLPFCSSPVCLPVLFRLWQQGHGQPRRPGRRAADAGRHRVPGVAGRLSYGGMVEGAPAERTWLRLAHRVDEATGEHECRCGFSRDGVHWTWGDTWTFPSGGRRRGSAWSRTAATTPRRRRCSTTSASTADRPAETDPTAERI